jgi:large subunit ribosomal protein L5
MTTETRTAPRLKTKYNTEIRDQLKASLGVDNVMQVPRFEKIVVNMGVGRAAQQPSQLEIAVAELTTITGQKPIITKAGKSIAGFKLREGQAIGAKVTLRGDRMWEFFDRLVAVAIPRIRDFRGLNPHSWDGRGNYTFGVADQLMFPEINYDKVDAPRGMDITIVTSATTDAAGKALLDAYGFPFKKGEDAGPPPKKIRRRGPVRGGGKGPRPSAGKPAASGKKK